MPKENTIGVSRGGAKGVLGGATAPLETLSAPPVGVLREFKVYLEYIVFVLNRITSLLQYIRRLNMCLFVNVFIIPNRYSININYFS